MFQNPKGTRDFYPAEMDSRKQVFEKLKSVANSYGFKEIESPALEYTSLFSEKSGDEIRQQLFNLEKKGEEELSLRPEMTPAAARMFIAKQKELPKPVKWYYFAKQWRYEKPQKGRLREFYQFGVEIFGSDKNEADAEVISLAADMLLSLGLKKTDFMIKINSRKLVEELFNILKITKKDAVIKAIDKYKKIPKEDFEAELKQLKLSPEQLKAINSFVSVKGIEGLKKLSYANSTGFKAAVDELSNLFRLLSYYKKNECVEFDPVIVRGLAYYTGIVFECYDSKESLRAIFGGGRYDNLIELFKGSKEPATGFAMGDVTLQLLLESRGLWPKPKQGVDYYIAVVDSGSMQKAVEIAEKLRKTYSVEIDIMQRKLGKQFEYANSIAAKNVIVIGENELKTGKLTVKDMKTGKETFSF